MNTRRTTIEYKGLQSILEKFDEMTGDGVQKLIKAHARLCAVQLALRTQPFSVGEKGSGKAHESGKKRVEYDISKVIRSDEKLLEIAGYMRDEKIQARMRQLVESGNYQAVVQILKNTGVMIGFGSDAEILRSAGAMKTIHKDNRDAKSGRTRSKTDKLYIADGKNKIDGYIKISAQRVGRSKAVFADCARKINAVKGDGARGIPAWAKSPKHGSHGQVNDMSGVKPFGYVEMQNTAPWASRVLPKQQIIYAQTFASEKFVKSLKRSFAAAAKKQGKMSDHISNEVNQTNTGE
jgi:hypothetical protein